MCHPRVSGRFLVCTYTEPLLRICAEGFTLLGGHLTISGGLFWGVFLAFGGVSVALGGVYAAVALLNSRVGRPSLSLLLLVYARRRY